jgi:hypothetical protein
MDYIMWGSIFLELALSVSGDQELDNLVTVLKPRLFYQGIQQYRTPLVLLLMPPTRFPHWISLCLRDCSLLLERSSRWWFTEGHPPKSSINPFLVNQLLIDRPLGRSELVQALLFTLFCAGSFKCFHLNIHNIAINRIRYHCRTLSSSPAHNRAFLQPLQLNS